MSSAQEKTNVASRAQETKKIPQASGWNHYTRWADRVSDSAAAYFTKRAHAPPLYCGDTHKAQHQYAASSRRLQASGKPTRRIYDDILELLKARASTGGKCQKVELRALTRGGQVLPTGGPEGQIQ